MRRVHASNTDGKHLGLALVVISRRPADDRARRHHRQRGPARPSTRACTFSTANLEWLITAYSLTFGGLLLFGGRTGDLYGKRRMFMIGIAIFAIASLLGGLATKRRLAHHHAGVPGRRGRHRRPHRAVADRHELPRGAASGTVPWASTPPCRAAAAPSGCSWAASSPTSSRGAGSSSSTCRSARWCFSWLPGRSTSPRPRPGIWTCPGP